MKKEADKHSHVRYHLGLHGELLLELEEGMHLGSEHQGLLANYGIVSHWVPHVCSHATSLSEDSTCADHPLVHLERRIKLD